VLYFRGFRIALLDDRLVCRTLCSRSEILLSDIKAIWHETGFTNKQYEGSLRRPGGISRIVYTLHSSPGERILNAESDARSEKRFVETANKRLIELATQPPVSARSLSR
jgi:hypothetical protein